jgi:hypothetical protein
MTLRSTLARDLTDHRWMVFKAGMFVLAFVLSGVVLVLLPRSPDAWSLAGVVGLYVLGAWCLCRAYYFAFYVITAYCDPQFRFAGVWSALRWVWCARRSG